MKNTGTFILLSKHWGFENLEEYSIIGFNYQSILWQNGYNYYGQESAPLVHFK